MASKKKLLTSAIALGTAAALTLGGTFAWQSISQKALNEASDIVNPGGRLHDDFDGTNKDVYVENFSDPDNGGQDIFARVRLTEYFEIIMNYGTEVENVEAIVGSYIGTDENEGVETIIYNGEVFKFDDRVNEDGTVNAGVDESETAWWTWTTGGQTVFMPTFNLNKDSLVADINGYYKYTNQITSQDIEGGQYTEMKTYEVDEEKTAYEIYDGDSNNVDELTSEEVADIIENGESAESYVDYYDGAENDITKYIQLVRNTHKAKSTGTTNGLISVEAWLALHDAGEETGSYWVYDTDGWVYWSSPIKAGEATGLLLDGIALNQVMDDTWYYSIDVEGQFVTANDVGKDDSTGFYHDDDEKPSENAEKLLEIIGVDFGEEDNSPVLTLKAQDSETVSHVSATTGDSFRLTTVDGTTPVTVFLNSYGSGPSLEEDTDFTYENDVLTITAKTGDIEGLNEYGSYLYVTGKVDDYNIYYGSILWDDDGKLTLAAFSNDDASDATVAPVGKGVEILTTDDAGGSAPDSIELNLSDYGSDYADTSNYTYENGTLTITNEEWIGRRVKVSYDGGYGYVIVTAGGGNSSDGGGQTDEEVETCFFTVTDNDGDDTNDPTVSKQPMYGWTVNYSGTATEFTFAPADGSTGWSYEFSKGENYDQTTADNVTTITRRGETVATFDQSTGVLTMEKGKSVDGFVLAKKTGEEDKKIVVDEITNTDEEEVLTLNASVSAMSDPVSNVGYGFVKLSGISYGETGVDTSDWGTTLTAKVYKQGETGEPIYTASGDAFYEHETYGWGFAVPQHLLAAADDAIDVYLTYSKDGVKAATEKTSLTYTRKTAVLKAGGYVQADQNYFTDGGRFLVVEGVDDPWKDMKTPDDVLDALQIVYNTYEYYDWGNMDSVPKMTAALTYQENSSLEKDGVAVYQPTWRDMYEKGNIYIYYTDSGVTGVHIINMSDYWPNSTFTLTLNGTAYSMSFGEGATLD